MTDRLTAEGSLAPGESLRSSNDQFSLVLQEDGNLVLYDQGGAAIWATGTDGQDIARVRMQQDGNLVLYAPGGDAAWASGTNGNDGAYIILQDDRNLVIYTSEGNPIWATDTSV